MKKIFVIAFCVLFSLPAFAGNLLQKQYENNEDKMPKPENILYLLTQDYQGYYHNQDSMFGTFMNDKKYITAVTTPNKEINLKYLNKIIQNIRSCIDEKESECKYIYVDDVDFQKLNDTVKKDLSLYNNLYSGN